MNEWAAYKIPIFWASMSQHFYTTILGFQNSHLQEDVPDNASELVMIASGL